MRQFDTGATRNTDDDKLDFEGFLAPSVLKRFAQYMHEHRLQADGKLRDSDNWQKGIPIDAYMKSMWRHFFAVWEHHRGGEPDEDLETSLCALLFNVQGMLFETLRNAGGVPLATMEEQIVLAKGFIPQAKENLSDIQLAYAKLISRVEKIDQGAAEYMRTAAKATRGFYYSGDLMSAFTWDRTPQGHDYWYAIHLKLDDVPETEDEQLEEVAYDEPVGHRFCDHCCTFTKHDHHNDCEVCGR